MEVISGQCSVLSPEKPKRRAKYQQCTLMSFFSSRKVFWREGMNALQEGPELFISDNCITPEDVAEVDAAAVCRRAGADCLIPEGLR